MIKGFDASQFNTVDFAKAKAEGYQFALIRTGYGGGGVDGTFAQKWAAAKAAGLVRLAYHFAYPGRSSGAQQARDMMNIVKTLEPGDGIALDMEDEPVYGRVLVPSDVAWAKDFLDTAKQITGGVNGLLYLNTSLKARYDWSSIKNANYGLWQANYGVNNGQPGAEPSPSPWAFNAIWQYTSKGEAGNCSPIDLNIFNGDNIDQLKKYGAGGTVSVPPSSTPAARPQPATPTATGTYTVQRGDSLSSIAAKFGTTWQALQSVNGLPNPNLIFPGQVLRVPGSSAAKTYTVQRGDNLSGIASKFGTSWQRLQQLNGLPNANLIYPGQVLKIG